MFNCCLGKSVVTASNNNLLQDPHYAPNRRANNTSPRSQPTSNASSSAIANIFAYASRSKPDTRSLPSGQNATMAKNAIDYVAAISTVTAYRAKDLYTNTHRDGTGRLVDSTLSAQGSVLKGRLKAYRDLANVRHNIQLAKQDTKGEPLSEAQQKAQLAKHVLAALHETAEKHNADQMPANCYEKALLSFEFMAKRHGNPQLDVVGLTPSLPRTATHASTGERIFLPRGPDHTVMIIGRSPESDVTAPKTWGPNAIICDASNNEFYYAKDLDLRFAQTVTGSADGPLIFESVISLPEDGDYDPNPSVLHDIPADQAASADLAWAAFRQADTGTGADDQSDNEALFF